MLHLGWQLTVLNRTSLRDGLAQAPANPLGVKGSGAPRTASEARGPLPSPRGLNATSLGLTRLAPGSLEGRAVTSLTALPKS